MLVTIAFVRYSMCTVGLTLSTLEQHVGQTVSWTL